MTCLLRWKYHLQATGPDALWLVLAVSAGFLVLAATGGEGIRNPAALTVWSEIVVPGLAAFLIPFAASPIRDPNWAIVCTRPFPAWLVYVERALLLAVGIILSNAAVCVTMILGILPGEPVSLAYQAVAAGLPVLGFFTALALMSSLFLKSPAAGGAASLTVWLFFLLNRHFAIQDMIRYVYPFQAAIDPSTPVWIENRIVLSAASLILMGVFATRVRHVSPSQE